jgi:tricorn protease
MNRVAIPGYLRFPHVHDDLLAFVAEDDVWLAPATGGRAWRLTSDGGQASHPRFSPDGATIAWTSWRDGSLPEVYTADTDGGTATRRTYWGDPRTRVTGWTRNDEVLAITAADQPSSQRTMAYAVPLDAPPRRLPFGQVNDLALTASATVLLTAQRGDPSHWKRYRGGTAGRLWVATAEDPLFTRVLSNLNGQLAAPMIIGDRLVFLSDHEGTGNLYSTTLDGGDLRRHTDHDGFYARNPATDGISVVYHVAGDIWRLDSLAADAQPRKLDIQLAAQPAARRPRVITAADHLGELDCDETGQASVVEVRGTVHWLTHADGPARALSVNPNARARLPRILGTTGKVAWVTDAGAGHTGGRDAIQIVAIEPESAAAATTITAADLGNVTQLVASPDGEKLAAASHDGRLLIVDVASGEVTELAANDDGDIEDVSWSPDSAWLAWAQPGPQPLARIRLARVEDGLTVDVTDGRFVDSDPVFTVDGLYLAFLSRRTFDPIYDAHSFDLSFPFGARPYLVPLAAYTLSPFGPLPGGRPVGGGENSKDSSEGVRLTVDADGISSRVVAVPVDEARYYSLAAAKGGLLWLRYPLSGVLGEGGADLDEAHRRPTLERFDLRKREASVLANEVSWFTVSGDGARLVIGDHDDVRVVPSDRKADNGSSDDLINVDLTRARFQADPAALWRHAYAEFGRLLRRDFWTTTMSDVDWDGVLDEYRFLLDRVRTSAEFGDLLWEAAGELGTSHAYVVPSGTFSARSALRGQSAAQLGADVVRMPDGRWVVERVLPGESSDPRARSPFAAPGVAVREGDEILAVDGRPLDPVYGPWPALAGTHGKPVELTIKPADPSLVPRPPAEPEEDADSESPDSAEAPAEASETKDATPPEGAEAPTAGPTGESSAADALVGTASADAAAIAGDTAAAAAPTASASASSASAGVPGVLVGASASAAENTSGGDVGPAGTPGASAGFTVNSGNGSAGFRAGPGGSEDGSASGSEGSYASGSGDGSASGSEGSYASGSEGGPASDSERGSDSGPASGMSGADAPDIPDISVMSADAAASGNGSGSATAADDTEAPAGADEAAEAPALELPQTRRVVIVPLYDDRRLRYQDWVGSRRALVRTRSDGRVGYLHVPDMMGEGWAHLHRDLRAEMGRDALIVDVRGNRGGHTSQLIVEKLARRIIGWKIPRHLRPYSYPQEARRGPLVAITDEFAGSDGDIVTAAIKTLALGPVIGARSWGGVIGIDGSGHGLVDGTRITIPRYATWFTDFGWSVENYGVDPDTEVLVTPDDWAAGHDPQLEVAVDRALALLEENPRPPLPDPSTGPDKRRPPLPPRP